MTAKIKQFVRDSDSTFIFVRGAKLARELNVRELRTRKVDHLAAAYDELGNVTVLTRDGYVKQLIGDEVTWR